MENKSQSIIENENAVKLEKLFKAARNARDTSDAKTAIKHYEEISMLEPNSWEALFYLVILKTETVKYGEISNSAISVLNCLPKVFEIVNNTITDETKKKEIVREIVDQCNETTVWLVTVSGKYYNELTSNNLSFDLMTAAVRADAKRNARYESAKRMANIGNIMCICGNLIEQYFDLNDVFYQNLAVKCWKGMLDTHFGHIQYYKVAVFNEESIAKIGAKIKRFEPAYEISNLKATEKSSYAIKAILIALGVFALSALWCLWFWFF